MKRNPDLIRAIAFATEQLPYRGQLQFIDGVDGETFFIHAKLMHEAGLIDCILTEFMSNDAPDAIITGLTWEGHDFLDAARSETLWKKAKESVIAPTMSWTFAILKEWLNTEIKKSLPSIGEL